MRNSVARKAEPRASGERLDHRYDFRVDLVAFRAFDHGQLTPAEPTASRAIMTGNAKDRTRLFGKSHNLAERPMLAPMVETAGVLFIAENGEGPGVRLRKVASGGEAP